MGLPVTLVGDNPERDIAGANAAGIRSVWVRRFGRAKDARHPATLDLDDLNGVPGWVAS